MADLKSYTSVYRFPYPLSGDSVQNTYSRIQELAERIEATYVTLGINLDGSTQLIQVGDAAGGALTGSYPNPTLDPSVALPNGITATTQAQSDGSTKVATTAYVDAYITGTIPDESISTAELADGAVTDIKVNAAAAIAYSKLNLATSIVNADVAAGAAIAYSKLALTGSILEADLAFSIATQAELDTVASNAATALSTHESDTTSIHGISNTADLVYTSDSRLTDSRTPTGSAGGVLGGSYPNPSFAVDMATQSELDTHTSASTSVHGISDTANLVYTSDSRLSDSRTPSGAAGGDLTGTYPNPTLAAAGTSGTYTKVTTDSKGRVTSGTTLSESDIPALSPSKVTGTAVITSDSRLSDARTPTSHAGTHVPGGSDVLDYTKIIGYGTALPTWNATTHPEGVLWVVNTVGEPYSLYRSDGVSAWKQVGGGGASVTASDTAPSSPTSGALWFDSTTGKTFIWYVDGSSNQWVEVGEASQLSIPTHGSTHVRGGTDVLDGDRVTIDYVPTYYTRNSAASGAGDVTDLTAHLSGLDVLAGYGQPIFTTEAARDAAITSPVKGMRAYITAPTIPATSGTTFSGIPSGIQTIYNGNVWVCITPVSAANGLSSTSITSTTYTNALWSAAPLTLTMVTGTMALIQLSARIVAAGNYYFVGVKTATVGASDYQSASIGAVTQTSTASATYVLGGLTAGTNTFTVQMRSNAGAFSIDQVNLTVTGIA